MPDELEGKEVVKYTDEESQRIGSAITIAMRENAAKTGKNLMEIATARTEKIFLESVINRAQELVSHRNNLYIARENLDKEIALFDKRIAAVEAGEIKLTPDGRLIFNDVLLR